MNGRRLHSRRHGGWLQSAKLNSKPAKGFAAVVSPRFGDIFRNNCTKAGLVPAQLTQGEVDELMTAVRGDPALELTVDVERASISAPAIGFEASFPLDDFTRHRLLEGLDDIGLTERHGDVIDGFEASRPAWLPSVTAAG